MNLGAWRRVWLAISVAIVAGTAFAEEPSKKMDEIEVIGTAPLPGPEQPFDRVPANVQLLDERDLESLAPLDSTAVLGRRVGSVHLTQTQNNPYQPDVVYRGFASSFLLGTPQGLSVFQDGVRLNDFLGDAMNWDLVPEDSLATVAVVPGANPLFGRNTLGGAIVLGTKSGRTHPGTEAEVSYGSFDRLDVGLEHGGTLGADGAFDYFLQGDFDREDGFRDFSEGELVRLFGRAGWRGTETEAWLTYNLARNELRGNGFVPESLLRDDRSAVFTHPDIFEPALDFVTAHLTRTFGPGLRIDASAYFRRLDIDQFNADAAEEGDEGAGGEDEGPIPGVNNDTRIEQRRFGGTAQATYGLAGALGDNSLALGFDGERGEADVRFTEQAGFVNEQRAVVATGEPELAADVDTGGTAFGVYATDTFTPLPSLSLTASLRYDRTTIDIDNRIDPASGGEHAFGRVNPAFGLNWRAAEGLDVYGRYGESFRTPSAIELSCANEDDPCPLPVAFADDPPLEEVKSQSFEAGLRARPLRDTRASLAFFHTAVDDDILFVASSRTRGFFQNVDETRRMGVEAGVEGRVRTLDWFVQYSFTEATFESTAAFPSAAGENVARPGDELPGVPNHLLKAGLGAALPWGVWGGADLQYTGGQFLRGDESNERGSLDGYVVLNAGLSYTWRWVTLFARAENLLDTKYESFGAFGENVFAGGRVERFLSPGAPLGGWFGVRVAL